MLGLTQKQLGEAIGVSSGQMHKIENGLNQISAGLLYQIAHVLDVPIIYFYQHIRNAHIEVERSPFLTELIRNFSSIQDDKLRDAFSQIVRGFGCARRTLGESRHSESSRWLKKICDSPNWAHGPISPADF